MFLLLTCLPLQIVIGEQLWISDSEKEQCGKLIKTLGDVSLIQCVLKCKHYSGCQIIGYDKDKSHCKFYQKDGEKERITTTEEIFYPISKQEDTTKKAENEIESKNTNTKDCLSIYQQGNMTDGVYTLNSGVKIYCDQTTDGGEWTVFQKRTDNSVSFYRGWNAYRNGFGNIESNFWLGNDFVHNLTNPQSMNKSTLRIDMTDYNWVKYWVKYDSFSIDNEKNKYKISVAGFTSGGNIGDSLIYHNGMNFSTYDHDNDIISDNCANRSKGAWWYKACYSSNLNGEYLRLYNWGGRPLRLSEMKLRKNV